MSTAALILSAGKGKRMRSSLPKVLHPCADWPLVAHVVKLACDCRCKPIVVVTDSSGSQTAQVLTRMFPKAPLVFAVQKEQLGTADAVRAGLEVIPRHLGQVLVLYGDVPLLRPKTIGRLAKAAKKNSLAFLTAYLDDPKGYGRVIRSGDKVLKVIEHKDANKKERSIHEINVGVYLCSATLLRGALGRVDRRNAQREAYLTDVVALAAKENGACGVVAFDSDEVLGVNTRAELAIAEAIMQQRLIADYFAFGVTFQDRYSVKLGKQTRLGRDVVIGPGVQLLGQVTIGSGTLIEGPAYIKDTTIGPNVVVHSFCHLDGAKVGPKVSVGPFARLRPGARLDAESRVGNFVEIKKSRLGRGAKANHLTYLGDASVGPHCNIGAGTITCNYDGGPIKHPTKIGAGAFVGSNTTLVAPVRIGAGAYVAAGSTINSAVPKDALALGRARQVNKHGYALRLRERTAKRKI